LNINCGRPCSVGLIEPPPWRIIRLIFISVQTNVMVCRDKLTVFCLNQLDVYFCKRFEIIQIFDRVTFFLMVSSDAYFIYFFITLFLF